MGRILKARKLIVKVAVSAFAPAQVPALGYYRKVLIARAGILKSQLHAEANLLRRIAANLLIVCVAVLLTLAALEALVRLLGQTDADGQFSFMDFTLEPYVLPMEKLRTPVQSYLDLEEWATVIYDEKLGWTYRPHARRQNGDFTINGAGIRAQREFSQQPPPDHLRIALFGDSFTAGDDVSDDEVWGARLELLLRAAGIQAEVLNFGVGAYGMDQAFLRWRHQGKAYEPDIVIFGLQPDNLKRNLNVFRQLMNINGPPFTKPRFVLADGGLELLNSPALPPDQLIAAFETFAAQPLAAYEHYYRSRYVASNWWAESRLASLLYEALKQTDNSPNLLGIESEGGQLGKAIVDAFAEDVREQDTAFIVLHMPLQAHLVWKLNGIVAPFQFLLDHCREAYYYIPFEDYMRPDHANDEFWSATKHYGPRLHTLLAEAVAQRILDCLQSDACALSRFDDHSAYKVAGVDSRE